MATATQRDRLRADVGATTASLDNTEADAIFVEAGETYTDTASQTAYTRVIAIRRLLANSAKLTSYRQNSTTESASDVFKHLMQLLDFWKGETDEAVSAAGGGAMRFGKTTRLPARIKEYPSD